VTAAEVTITAGAATHPVDKEDPTPRERASKRAGKILRKLPDRGRTDTFCVYFGGFIFVLPLPESLIL
jgi:hypothetical protein